MTILAVSRDCICVIYVLSFFEALGAKRLRSPSMISQLYKQVVFLEKNKWK